MEVSFSVQTRDEILGYLFRRLVSLLSTNKSKTIAAGVPQCRERLLYHVDPAKFVFLRYCGDNASGFAVSVKAFFLVIYHAEFNKSTLSRMWRVTEHR
jgi:hypothetical protein